MMPRDGDDEALKKELSERMKLSRENTGLKRQCGELRRFNDQLREHVGRLVARVTELEGGLRRAETIRAFNGELRTQIGALEAKLAEQTGLAVSSASEVARLTKEMVKVQDAARALETRLEAKHRAEIERLSRGYEARLAQSRGDLNAKHKVELQDLRSRLRSAESRSTQFAEQLRATAQEKIDLDRQLQELAGEVKGLSSLVDERQEVIDQINAEKTVLTARIRERESAITLLTSALREAQSTVDARDVEVAELRAVVAHQKGMIAELQAQLKVALETQRTPAVSPIRRPSASPAYSPFGGASNGGGASFFSWDSGVPFNDRSPVSPGPLAAMAPPPGLGYPAPAVAGGGGFLLPAQSDDETGDVAQQLCEMGVSSRPS